MTPRVHADVSMKNLPCRLVLASVSPQRKEILSQAGYAFSAADPGEAEEAVAAALPPEELAIAKARAKAAGVAAALPPPYPALVAAADTLVVLDREVIGKPLDRRAAIAILNRLSGSRHRVISGLCLWPVVRGNRGTCSTLNVSPDSRMGLEPVVAAAVTWVNLRRMSTKEIEEYVAGGQSDGKAGAYAIQANGDKFVERLEGSFLNVVGFPLELFEELLPRALRNWGM